MIGKGEEGRSDHKGNVDHQNGRSAAVRVSHNTPQARPDPSSDVEDRNDRFLFPATEVKFLGNTGKRKRNYPLGLWRRASERESKELRALRYSFVDQTK
jgi:hypothetical protein